MVAQKDQLSPGPIELHVWVPSGIADKAHTLAPAT